MTALTPDPKRKLDPEPWVIHHNGLPGPRTGIYKPRFTNGFGEVVMRSFTPRPGYSQHREDYPA